MYKNVFRPFISSMCYVTKANNKLQGEYINIRECFNNPEKNVC